MSLTNLLHADDTATFNEAVVRGLGKDRGLYFPSAIAPFDDIERVLDLPFIQRSSLVLSTLIGDAMAHEDVTDIVEQAFTFPAPLVEVEFNTFSLELFHGPTLAFKDFGGRFMAQCLSRIGQGQKITILTATSGDTGAAVAHAFHGMPGVNVVILYPKGKISPLQEKLFTTLGGNIHTIAIDKDFDACQHMVKAAFDDPEVREGIALNSANSINISRLFAQVCYYFEALAQLKDKDLASNVKIAVPSGNFGNLTAGVIGRVLGLPIAQFIAATNENDTVPRYLQTGEWQPKPTVATLSNAMDVSAPNNWPRIEAMLKRGWLPSDALVGEYVDEESTQIAMRHLAQLGYISEPHAAVAYHALRRHRQEGDVGVFLGTAHPAKFRESVENILGQPISLPQALADAASKPTLSDELPADYSQLKAHLLARYAA